MAGFSQDAVDEVQLMFADETAARALFEKGREDMLAASPAELAHQMKAHAPGADLAFLTDEAITMQQACVPGIQGSWDDCWAQLTPWGFELAQISVPVLLLHSADDRAVPFSHGQWLAAHIPGVEAWLFDHEGHGTLRENHIGESARLARRTVLSKLRARSTIPKRAPAPAPAARPRPGRLGPNSGQRRPSAGSRRRPRSHRRCSGPG
jgi:pimeloyl-ACP methyl ester carboxylesterase